MKTWVFVVHVGILIVGCLIAAYGEFRDAVTVLIVGEIVAFLLLMLASSSINGHHKYRKDLEKRERESWDARHEWHGKYCEECNKVAKVAGERDAAVAQAERLESEITATRRRCCAYEAALSKARGAGRDSLIDHLDRHLSKIAEAKDAIDGELMTAMDRITDHRATKGVVDA